MGRSRSLTTLHAARSCFNVSDWPTQRIGSSSGCARCKATPSIVIDAAARFSVITSVELAEDRFDARQRPVQLFLRDAQGRRGADRVDVGLLAQQLLEPERFAKPAGAAGR